MCQEHFFSENSSHQHLVWQVSKVHLLEQQQVLSTNSSRVSSAAVYLCEKNKYIRKHTYTYTQNKKKNLKSTLPNGINSLTQGWSWLALNFSLNYCCWIKHQANENYRNDHILKSCWFFTKLSLSLPWEMYIEQ